MTNPENEENPFSSKEIIIGCPWAYDSGFSIETVEPSGVVRLALHLGVIGNNTKVLNLGCGKNPRNALFLAHLYGCSIDAIDLEQPDFPNDITPETFQRINFKQGSILDFDYGRETYQAAVMARLIQYLSPEEIDLLLSKVSESLLPQGGIALSYTAQGGILNRSGEYNIQTFAHPIDSVTHLLEQKGLSIKVLLPGTSKSTHVPHAGEEAVTFDIVAQKV